MTRSGEDMARGWILGQLHNSVLPSGSLTGMQHTPLVFVPSKFSVSLFSSENVVKSSRRPCRSVALGPVGPM